MNKGVVLALFILIAAFACSTNEPASNTSIGSPEPTALSPVYASSSTFGEEGRVRGVANLDSLHVDGAIGGIRVSGTGTVSVEPDVAILQVGVEVFAGKVSTARSEASKAMDSVVSVLKKEGVEEKDIQTTRFNIYPRYDYEEVTINGKRIGTQVLTGYTVNNTVKAKIYEIDKVGEIIDKGADAGGDYARINGVDFTVDDPTPYQTEIRKMAVEDAVGKAQEYALLTNVELGPVVELNEMTSGSVHSPYEADYGMRMMAAAPPTTSISAGQLEISLTVNTLFAIK
ncbi:MAG: SIMPL domain-containing protein [Chloroflexota bacterium]|nr:SIMPL domain-containing protein [Chloroflexota bacterium]